MGRLSDAIGRRPVLGIAIASALASTAVFLTVPTVAGLYAGRFLSGISTGLVLATGAAYLADLAPGRAGLVTRATTDPGDPWPVALQGPPPWPTAPPGWLAVVVQRLVQGAAWGQTRSAWLA